MIAQRLRHGAPGHQKPVAHQLGQRQRTAGQNRHPLRRGPGRVPRRQSWSDLRGATLRGNRDYGGPLFSCGNVKKRSQR